MAAWLVLDIGNSAIKGAVFAGSRVEHAFRLHKDAYREKLQEVLGRFPISRAGICSVVPSLNADFRDVIRSAVQIEPEFVHAGMRLPLTSAYETPETLGIDRLAAAVAGFCRYSRQDGVSTSVIVIDAGTATTFDVVSREAVYMGGTIAPGPGLLLQSLARGTASLPEVEPQVPLKAIGRSTREALQSGIMMGFLDMVSGMLERIGMELPDTPRVVVTGGWGGLLAEHLPRVDFVVPDLVLHGVRQLMELNAAPYPIR